MVGKYTQESYGQGMEYGGGRAVLNRWFFWWFWVDFPTFAHLSRFHSSATALPLGP